ASRARSRARDSGSREGDPTGARAAASRVPRAAHVTRRNVPDVCDARARAGAAGPRECDPGAGGVMQVFLPENAPFTEAQRAWLNGFVAGLLGAERVATATAPDAVVATPSAEDFPWHDPTLALEERMKLAEGRPLERRMMAAMGQLDCGQCGYQCRTYAEAIAAGVESDLGKCVPGGRATAKKLKELVVQGAIVPVAR